MKRRFHFCIRDLFWLTLVVALAVGWWLDPWKASAMRFRLYEDASHQTRLIDNETRYVFVNVNKDWVAISKLPPSK
jgi:hypothetical protein